MADGKERKLKTPDDITPEIREKLQERWGDYSDEDYIALERNYRNLINDNHDVFDEVAMHLRNIAEWLLLQKKAIRMGDTKMSTALNANIKQSFAMVKDAREQKVTAKRSIDGLVRRLEERGMLKDGVMILEGVVDYIRNDHGTYHMSKDAADAMMLSIVNAMRFNNGLSDLMELPEDMQVQDRLGEFIDEPTLEEKQTMMELGLYGSGKPGGK